MCVCGGGGGCEGGGGMEITDRYCGGENQLSGVWWVIKGIYRCTKSSTMGIGWK